MSDNIAEIAKGLTANERWCVMAYSRSRDHGYLFESVYQDRGGRIDAAYAADLIRFNNTGIALWEERRTETSVWRSYRLTPLGLSVRQHLLDKASEDV